LLPAIDSDNIGYIFSTKDFEDWLR
jgi:hypothetical protein